VRWGSRQEPPPEWMICAPLLAFGLSRPGRLVGGEGAAAGGGGRGRASVPSGEGLAAAARSGVRHVCSVSASGGAGGGMDDGARDRQRGSMAGCPVTRRAARGLAGAGRRLAGSSLPGVPARIDKYLPCVPRTLDSACGHRPRDRHAGCDSVRSCSEPMKDGQQDEGQGGRHDQGA
jgi:hypothetical protein